MHPVCLTCREFRVPIDRSLEFTAPGALKCLVLVPLASRAARSVSVWGSFDPKLWGGFRVFFGILRVQAVST